jgi:hypothetical protein
VTIAKEAAEKILDATIKCSSPFDNHPSEASTSEASATRFTQTSPTKRRTVERPLTIIYGPNDGWLAAERALAPDWAKNDPSYWPTPPSAQAVPVTARDGSSMVLRRVARRVKPASVENRANSEVNRVATEGEGEGFDIVSPTCGELGQFGSFKRRKPRSPTT